MEKCSGLIIISIILIVLFFLFTGCPPEPPVDEPPSITITANVDDFTVVLTWNTVEDLASFTVYRKEESGDFYEVETINSPDTTYRDSTCPFNIDLSYKIRFTITDNTTFDSKESNSVNVIYIPDAYMTEEVTASTLEYTDRIRIFWEAVNGVDSYRVYRYTSTGFTDPTIFDSTVNEYYDLKESSSGPVIDTPYYYRIACVVDSMVFGESSDYSAGIYHDEIDYCEKNNTLEEANELGVEEEIAFIYSFQNGDAQDIDWYKYTGTETDIRISVALDNGSLLSGQIQLVIFNTGLTAEITDTPGGVYLDYSGSDDLFFKVEFIDFNPDLDVLASYRLELEFL